MVFNGVYRYSLRRTWNPAGGSYLFVMLNPSTADATIDDPTIAKCVRYAKAWGIVCVPGNGQGGDAALSLPCWTGK